MSDYDRAACVLVCLVVLIFALMLLAGCSGVRVQGDCTLVREVRTEYHCEPGGTLEHMRVIPEQP